MAKEFVRNIRNTKCIGKEKEPLETNEQNDLLNQRPDVYVRNEDYYHCLTNAIQKIDSLSKYIDVLKKENSNPVKDKVSVEISTGELEKELNQIQRDLSNLYNVEIVELKEAIKELNDTIQNLPLQDLEEFKKKISELEDKINNGLSDLEKEIEKINSRLDSLGGGRSSTIVIANYDSHENSKNGADIVINEGENASEKINEAIQSLKGTGGEIKLMEGKYNIEYNIDINVNGVHLTGIPKSTILIQNKNWYKNPSNSSDVYIIKGDYCIVSNIIIIGNEVSRSCDGVYSFGSMTIDNCVVERMGRTGLQLGGRCRVENSVIKDCISDGIYGVDDVYINNCTIYNNGSAGINMDDDVTVRNCSITDNSKVGIINRGNGLIVNNFITKLAPEGYLIELTSPLYRGYLTYNIIINGGIKVDSDHRGKIEYNIEVK